MITGSCMAITAESRSARMSHITLDKKHTGKPSAGNLHAGFDEAGAGNRLTIRLVRHSQRKRGAIDRPSLRSPAPVLDPTKDERKKRQRTEGLAMSLTTPFSVQKLQTALHAKAKESPNFRFHALYDKVYRKDVLAYAYERCKANGGAAGVDNQTFENIEAYGRERWLDELTQELKSRTYQPQPVRRVYIPKPDGKQRPLGIPTIRDRVVQTSATAGARTDLRGRLAAGAVCLSGRPQRVGRSASMSTS